MPAAENGTASQVESRDRVLVFTIEDRELAVPIGSVIEVLGHRGSTQVPCAVRTVEGIMPVRGRMVTLFSVRRGLGLPPRLPGAGEQVIVVESKGDRLGLVVDAVSRVAAPRAEVGLLDLGLLLGGAS